MKACILLPWRFVRFARENCELYLLDFCYMVSYWTVLGCALAYLRITTGLETPLHRYNAMITRCIFVYANGALVWSVAIFRNSLVFYNIDQITSCFIHLSPALLCWCVRWGGGQGFQLIEESFPAMFEVCPGVSAQAADDCLRWSRLLTWCTECEVGLKGFLVQPVLFYVIAWALPYYLFHFCLFRGYIERCGKETLYGLVMSDAGKSRLIRLLPEPLHPLGYLLQHFAVVASLGVLTIAFWSNFVLHTAFILLMLVTAVHNGSTYTFRVFGLRYADSVLQKHKDEIMPVMGKRYSTGAMARRYSTGAMAYQQLKAVEAAEDLEED
mmetsp:Transcript_41501/g.75202  ORF Transcript_41501/g.75202 Transcript_41501/m.75202 type:complete len:326 (-) Transcript_41501:13-990(-)